MKNLSLEKYKALYPDRDTDSAGNVKVLLPEKEDLILPPRKNDTHKYSYGRALIVAGSVGFSGAPVLAANACERSGAGLTTLMVPDNIYTIVASRCDGSVVTPLPSESGCASPAALDIILPALKRANACVIGPGFGTGNSSAEILAAVIKRAECPLVLDADALTILGRMPDLFSVCRTQLILTPHEGEFRRIGGILEKGRLAGVLHFGQIHPDVILLLKGHGTLICKGDAVSVNPMGNAAMAKGGSGDVLCGILCALLAQGFEPLSAVRRAAWLHGRAGDLARKETGEYSLAPSDLIRFLPKAFIELM
ncbi:MAG: NAD(P)H-hydrate dehydratase [Oscillospiraceae bacterium]|nr:NAD(P)H-hydrate dehydratase [Oscillospiraceae bacterium]